MPSCVTNRSYQNSWDWIPSSKTCQKITATAVHCFELSCSNFSDLHQAWDASRATAATGTRTCHPPDPSRLEPLPRQEQSRKLLPGRNFRYRKAGRRLRWQPGNFGNDKKSLEPRLIDLFIIFRLRLSLRPKNGASSGSYWKSPLVIILKVNPGNGTSLFVLRVVWSV